MYITKKTITTYQNNKDSNEQSLKRRQCEKIKIKINLHTLGHETHVPEDNLLELH